MIEVLSSGNLNLIQDIGRFGRMHEGVSRSGAMDAEALRYANALVGNEETAACLEITTYPFRLRFHVDMVVAATGALAEWNIGGATVPPWWARQAAAGQELEVKHPRAGARVYLAFGGGLDVPIVLDSRSTDFKAGFGGYQGRGIKRGDRLAVLMRQRSGAGSPGLGCAPVHVRAFWRDLTRDEVTLRVLAGAEVKRFTPQSLARFEENPWLISPSSNRQGYRLEGSEPLLLTEQMQLLSHGIVPGTIQVPPDGQPIIQLAEANTCGGYPKIGTIIAADLWKVGQMKAPSRLRFRFVEEAEALDALRSLSNQANIIRRGWHSRLDGAE